MIWRLLKHRPRCNKWPHSNIINSNSKMPTVHHSCRYLHRIENPRSSRRASGAQARASCKCKMKMMNQLRSKAIGSRLLWIRKPQEVRERQTLPQCSLLPPNLTIMLLQSYWTLWNQEVPRVVRLGFLNPHILSMRSSGRKRLRLEVQKLWKRDLLVEGTKRILPLLIAVTTNSYLI